MKRPAPTGRASTEKFSVEVGGHRTSISLETEFMDEFRRICVVAGEPLGVAVTRIDRHRDARRSLSSAIRLFVLNHLRGTGKRRG